MEIRMKRPGEQYSIYKRHDETADSGTGSGGDKPANCAEGCTSKPQAAGSQ